MSIGKNNLSVIAFLVTASLGLGFAIGFSIKGKSPDSLDHDNNFAPTADLSKLSVDELRTNLSNLMLPDAEYEKLRDAIHKTAMGLLVSQAPGLDETNTTNADNELKKVVTEKYSRTYFTQMNANSMADLTEQHLRSILSFYSTDAGQKFLKLSPEIIKSTMETVQRDLSTWLPTAVEAVAGKFKANDAG